MKNKLRLLPTVLLFGLMACGQPPSTVPPVTSPGIEALQRVAVELSPVSRDIELDGLVEAVNRAVVSSQTSGRVTALPFDVGDYVTQGSVIVRITDSEQQTAVEVAQAQLTEAQAQFAEVDQQLQRIQEVFARGAVSQAELDKTKAAQKSAAARVESAKAALADANQRLSYTQVVAPYSGILVRRLVDVGATVAPGTPLLEGISLEDLRIRVSVPQHHIGPLRQHKQAKVVLDSGSVIAAENLRIAPSADAVTHTVETLLELPKGSTATGLFPGTLVKVAFAVGMEEQLVLPVEAIARRGEVNAVYRFTQDGQLEFRYVRLGKMPQEGAVVVTAGLEVGDEVALDPLAAAAVYKQQQFKQSK
ncbi:efflux RND transporter periplasmic adaptor subunit [Aliiglaciecola sp. CAU 1673]|uniref:efflux RND transporter periplasmic adaptor subunit n=1 Tax=Aliiglaciecola sp. CAU 1673 TaxID=3032595 RepID=UPI0023DA17CE|nr:efflux RND transporter periplasmic adaptor subunit [Aliiglaciecola sp. CAU 1673]MDF2180363.1 efflux RND transporter periplasmic adaptor subunit [Aliiglaciecola sp. CAU 1673]